MNLKTYGEWGAPDASLGYPGKSRWVLAFGRVFSFLLIPVSLRVFV